MHNTYTLKTPKDATSCVIFSSPHSGSDYPASLLATTELDSLAIRSSEDAFVDELFMDAPSNGAHLLAAHAPRAFIDLNRAADELDPALIRGVKRAPGNARIMAGLGIIPRVVGNGQVIRSGKMQLTEAQERIAKYYAPYHDCLQNLVGTQREAHGMAILLDCHSMPQKSLDAAPLVNKKTPDIILGDRFGASCDRWLVDLIAGIFASSGLVVARNAPFSGGFITRHYGRPSKGVHAVQIEINRALYMNEARIERADNFGEFQKTLSKVTRLLARIGPVSVAVAAE
ncbi:MAG: N-formylglutamate amidohydrolase [Paracoccaceae bacterium]|jgi:N-formylglutamate deformylase